MNQQLFMKKKTETFAGLMAQFQYHFDVRPVFDDFLTMTLTCLCLDTRTGKSHDEDLYMDTVKKYAAHDLRHQFPKMFAALIQEMESRSDSSGGNDVLGEWYQETIANTDRGQTFTPWPACMLVAGIAAAGRTDDGKRLRILDPACGSGRMLLAASRISGPGHYYYGIDIDHTCTQMAAVNLFLNGIFHGEVMCADALDPDDFRIGYRFSTAPFGVFRITDKEQSLLWQMHRGSFLKQAANPSPDSKLGGSQLSFF